MQRAAVICEFNPFHNGHQFLLKKIKEDHADEIVCIMSGSFVQRGDIAITDKYSRTKAALQYGADMVVELPTVYAMAGARTFAENGVKIAAALHCDKLCFGAEDDLETLLKLSDLLNDEAVNAAIMQEMKNGQYYPKALSVAVGAEYAAVIEKPNNILALEYIRACQKHHITPIALKRIGVEHDDEATTDNIASASLIRRLITAHGDYRAFTPMMIESPVTLKRIEPAILYRLKTISADDMRKIADVSEGIENRIMDAAKRYNSIKEIYEAVKTKRYTMARIRRIVLSAFLHITAESQGIPVPYLRILGVRNDKETMLKNASLPLIIKVRADYDLLDISPKEIFDADLRASEAMNIAAGTTVNEFTQPVIKL